MIKPNELRIGNLLEYFIGEDGCQWETTKLDGWDLYQCEIKNENFNKVHRGITLAEDWLIKLGFYTDSPYLTHYIFGLKYNRHTKFFVYGDITFDQIKYVHQLQNLHFALTGEELTVHES
jgi:hypothetical protein